MPGEIDHGVPVRFVATTYNLWADTRWPEREAALRAYIRTSQPDILCLQELRPETRLCLDEELPNHQRIDDPFEGWAQESNIYWLADFFSYVEHGTVAIGHICPWETLRRLFWVRLKLKGSERTLLVSTVHYTFQGNQPEAEKGINPRLDQSRAVAAALNRIVGPDEPVLLMGDLNDCIHPIKILEQHGFVDSFTACGIPLQPTYPAIPTTPSRIPYVYDWQLHRGPLDVMTTTVVDFYLGDLAPSDHKPVVTTYRLK